MSDDTPTSKFDPSGDAPTERFETPSAEVAPVIAEERKSRKLMLILGIIGGALLIGVIILLVLLLTRGGGTPVTPSGSPTPSATTRTAPKARNPRECSRVLRPRQAWTTSTMTATPANTHSWVRTVAETAATIAAVTDQTDDLKANASTR